MPPLQHALDISLVIFDHRLVAVILEQRRGDQEVGRRAVDGRGNVVERRQAQQRLDIDIVRLGRHGVPEKNQRVDPAVGDERSELLIAAQRARLEQRNAQVGMRSVGLVVLPAVIAERLLDHLARCTGAYQMVRTEFRAVPIDPFGQVALHVVVGHQSQRFDLLFHIVVSS